MVNMVNRCDGRPLPAAQASGEGAPSFKRAAQLFQEAEEMSAGAVAVANGGC